MIKGRVWKADTMELVTILLKKEISEANIYKSVRVWNSLGVKTFTLFLGKVMKKLTKNVPKTVNSRSKKSF